MPNSLAMLSYDGVELRNRLDPIGGPLPIEGDAFRLKASAGNGLVSRLQAARRHFEEFVVSIEENEAPPFPERDRQEANLYEFVASGVSAIGCACMFAFALASAVAGDLPVAKALELYPRGVLYYFKVWFPADPITSYMKDVLDSHEFGRLNDLRNELDHRGTQRRGFSRQVGSNHHPPGRLVAGPGFSKIPGDELGTLLTRASFAPLLGWLEDALERLVSGVEAGFTSPAQDAESQRHRQSSVATHGLRSAMDRAMEAAKAASEFPECRAEIGKYTQWLTRLGQ